MDLHRHFLNEGIQYMQFSFRWMNCILLRELPLRAIMRVWDTYLSEEEGGFENFHVYVCAVFLKTYRETLLNMQVGNADKNFIIAPTMMKNMCMCVLNVVRSFKRFSCSFKTCLLRIGRKSKWSQYYPKHTYSVHFLKIHPAISTSQ